MDFSLETRTLAFTAALVSFVVMIIMIMIRLSRRPYPGFTEWTLATAAISLSAVLVGLRGIIPIFYSIIVVNLCAVGGHLLLLHGLRRFYNQQTSRFNLLAAGVLLSGLIYATYINDDIHWRILMYSAVISVIYCKASVEMFRKAFRRAVVDRADGRFEIGFMATALLLLAFNELIRFGLTVQRPVQGSFPEPGVTSDPAQNIYLMMTLLLGIAFIISLIMLINKRLTMELEASRQELQQSTQRLATLHTLSKAIQQVEAVEDIAEMALFHLQQLVPAASSSVMLYDGANEKWTALAIRADAPKAVGDIVSSDLPPTLLAVLEKHEYYIDNELAISDVPTLVEKGRLSLHDRSLLVVPLWDQEMLIGCLYLTAHTPQFVTKEVTEITVEVAAHVAIAIKAWRAGNNLRLHAEELDRRVAERTVELQMTVDALHQQQERSHAVEEQLLRALRVGQVMTWEVDLATHTISFWGSVSLTTPALESMTQMLGEFFNTVHPDDRAYLESMLHKAIHEEGEHTATYQSTSQERHGATIWIAARGTRVLNDDGVPVKVIGASIDITDQVRVNKQMILQSQLLNAVGESVIATRSDGTIVYWNPGAEKLYGWRKDEALGHRTIELISVDRSAAYSLGVSEAMVRNGTWSGEFEDRRKDGSIVSVYSSCTPIVDDEGQRAGTITVSINITEQKRMEERLRILFHAAPDPIALMDNALILRDVNHAYETMTGHGRDELIGRSPIDLGIIAADGDDRVAAARDLVQQGKPVLPYVLTLRSKSGECCEVEVTLHGVTIAGESMLMLSMHNISARVQIEATLRESMRKLEEVNELKSRFVSTASHQFRTPLATISITAENLSAYRHRMDSHVIDKRLGKIIVEVRHMQSLIDDLLNLSRMQSTGFSIKPVAVDLNVECRSLVEQFLENPAIDHTVMYTSYAEPVYVQIDPKLIKDALANLIANALKYSPAGSTVRVTLTANDEQAILSVSDEGMGIPARDLPNLFQPFFRGSNINETPGTGLGLSIAKNVIDLHGGTLSVQSVVGKGTTLIITLPVQSAVHTGALPGTQDFRHQ